MTPQESFRKLMCLPLKNSMKFFVAGKELLFSHVHNEFLCFQPYPLIGMTIEAILPIAIETDRTAEKRGIFQSRKKDYRTSFENYRNYR